MHEIEPHYSWRNFYVASEDERSPYFQKEYSEFEFSNSVYDHVIHPQWDEIGSSTLFIKIIFANYDTGHAIIELIGEWNDCLYNDIMHLKRNIIDEMIAAGIHKFILVGENVLIFHSSDDCYYEEWFDEIDDGWIALVNFKIHVESDMKDVGIDHYFYMDERLSDFAWRTFTPDSLCFFVDQMVTKRLAY